MSAHGLGTRGGRVFRALGGAKLDPVRKELAIEAGRMADRLEQLNGVIAGDEKFASLLHFRMRDHLDDSSVATIDLVIDKPLGEARQLQLAFERLIRDLAAPATARAEPEKPKAEEPVDELAARIAARRAARAASGS